MSAGFAEVAALVARVCGVQVHSVDRLTASTFRTETGAGSFAVRLVRPDPAGFVDFDREAEATRIASDLGIGARFVAADRSAGAIVTEWVAGSEPLSAEEVQNSAELRRQIAHTMRALHRSGASLTHRFDPVRIIEQYRTERLKRGLDARPWSKRVETALSWARTALERAPAAALPCHCDPVPANIVRAGDRIVLIDWEYAGMNDPAWDLAYFALECGLEERQIAELLQAYGDPLIGPARLWAHKLLVACMGVLWSGLRDGAGTDAALRDWSRARLATAEALAAAADAMSARA